MARMRWLRWLAVLTVLALVAAACDGDDEAVTPEEVGALLIGQIWPETGPLQFLGAPQFQGVELAVADVNAAGGVLGEDVRVIRGDEAGDEARARDAAQRLLGEGAHAIIGAASSGMTQSFIQTLFDNEIPQCSPSNTSPVFSDQENATFYLRTVPPDEAVTPIIADRVIEDGHETVAIAARADDYGRALGDLLDGELTELGATVSANVQYDPNATTFDAEIEQLTEGDPDAVVLVSFDEGGPLAKGLLEAGLTGAQLYGADGVFAPTLPGLVDPDDPAVIDGMVVIGAAGSQEFNQRLAPVTENNLIYGGQSYDCLILLSLATEEVGDPTQGQEIVDAAIAASKDGTKCTTFAECRDLIAEGENIDYDGVGGPLDLDDVGDPTQVIYAIAQFQNGGVLTPVDSKDVDVTELA